MALQVQQLQIPASKTLDLASFLADPAAVRQWNLQGLPAGTFSLQNGILITRSQRWPLIIDPQVSLSLRFAIKSRRLHQHG